MIKKFILFFFALGVIFSYLSAKASPGNINRPFLFDAGMAMKFSKDFDVHSMHVPVLSASLPFSGKYFSLNLESNFDFGIQNFYFDLLNGIGLYVLPFKKIVSLHVKYYMSSGIVLFNNYGHIVAGGVDLDIPLTGNHYLSMAIDFYLRDYYKAFGYLGDDYFYKKSYGLMILLKYRLNR